MELGSGNSKRVCGVSVMLMAKRLCRVSVMFMAKRVCGVSIMLAHGLLRPPLVQAHFFHSYDIVTINDLSWLNPDSLTLGSLIRMIYGRKVVASLIVMWSPNNKIARLEMRYDVNALMQWQLGTRTMPLNNAGQAPEDSQHSSHQAIDALCSIASGGK